MQAILLEKLVLVVKVGKDLVEFCFHFSDIAIAFIFFVLILFFVLLFEVLLFNLTDAIVLRFDLVHLLLCEQLPHILVLAVVLLHRGWLVAIVIHVSYIVKDLIC